MSPPPSQTDHSEWSGLIQFFIMSSYLVILILILVHCDVVHFLKIQLGLLRVLMASVHSIKYPDLPKSEAIKSLTLLFRHFY